MSVTRDPHCRGGCVVTAFVLLSVDQIQDLSLGDLNIHVTKPKQNQEIMFHFHLKGQYKWVKSEFSQKSQVTPSKDTQLSSTVR